MYDSFFDDHQSHRPVVSWAAGIGHIIRRIYQHGWLEMRDHMPHPLPELGQRTEGRSQTQGNHKRRRSPYPECPTCAEMLLYIIRVGRSSPVGFWDSKDRMFCEADRTRVACHDKAESKGGCAKKAATEERQQTITEMKHSPFAIHSHFSP